MSREQQIEFPSMGSTYCRQEYGVYEYSEYPRSSVLAGETRRVFLDSFPTLEAAKAAYPDASFDDNGSGFNEPSLAHLPEDEDDLESFEREQLLKEQYDY